MFHVECPILSASLGNALITFVYILRYGCDGLRWNLPWDVRVPGFGGNLDLSSTMHSLN